MGKLEHGKYGGNIIELPFWKHFSIFFGGCYIWVVVSTPLKNISQLGLFFPIYGKHLPNHQSDIVIIVLPKTQFASHWSKKS
jgi:hypothetical protein